MEPNIVLFDIDNTLADMDHRLHYFKRDEMDWDEFEDQCIYDQPIMPTILVARAFKAFGKQVWCWSGRTERIRSQTEVWLRNNGVPFEQLLLRPKAVAVAEPTETTKLKWLTVSPVPQDRVICAYDDDPRVVKVLREQGKILVNRVMRPT
jgi:FMN phosphatase YigB (HAD superfamily)